MCKFVYIFCTDENPFGSCQPCSNNIHITYDDNTTAHRATCDSTSNTKDKLFEKSNKISKTVSM